MYALCCGYEDLNDHDRLRHDLILQTALGRDELLGSSPTLCRMENRASSRDADGFARVLFEQFMSLTCVTAALMGQRMPLRRSRRW